MQFELQKGRKKKQKYKVVHKKMLEKRRPKNPYHSDSKLD